MKWFIVLLIMLPLVDAVEIVEVMANPEGKDTGREWIKIYSNDEVEITDEWRLVENNKSHLLTLKQGSSTFSGDAIIADNWELFLIENEFNGPVFDSAFSLKNTGEELIIKKGNDTITYLSYEEVEEGESWIKGKAHVESNETTLHCSPKIIEKEILVEKILEKEIERKDVLYYLDYPKEVEINENITSHLFIVNQFNDTKNIEVQSYVHNGSRLVSTSYLNQWNGGWSGNKQTFEVSPESLEIIKLVNRVENNGNFNLRVKIVENNKTKNLDNLILIEKKNVTTIRPVEKRKETSLSIMSIIKKLFNA